MSSVMRSVFVGMIDDGTFEFNIGFIVALSSPLAKCCKFICFDNTECNSFNLAFSAFTLKMDVKDLSRSDKVKYGYTFLIGM